MSKNYTFKTAALKSTIFNTYKLDAQKILIYPGGEDTSIRINIIDFINSNNENTNQILTNISQILTSHTQNTTLHLNQSLLDIINDYNSNKNSFITKTTGDSYYATISSLSSYVLSSDLEVTLSGYLKSADLSNFVSKTTANTFTETNTFKKSIAAEAGLVSNSDIFVSNGVLTFEDVIDGTVTTRTGASGYQYVTDIPTAFNNGICYDIGEITNNTNLSSIRFSAEGRLVQTCELWFTTSENPPTQHQWPANTYWTDNATGAAPTLIASKNYRIVFRQEPNKIIASIAYLY